MSKKNIGGANVERDRVLSEDEIKELALRLNEVNMTEISIIAIWITLSTCCRIGELLRAKWSHINLENKTWRIPSENSKNEREHVIFISNFTINQFASLYAITGGGEDSMTCIFKANPKPDLINVLNRHSSIKAILDLTDLSLDEILTFCTLEIPEEYEPNVGWSIVWNSDIYNINHEHIDLIQIILKFAWSYSMESSNTRLWFETFFV